MWFFSSFDWECIRRSLVPGRIKHNQILDNLIPVGGCDLGVNPSAANLRRGNTRQGALDVASRSLGQVEAHLIVRNPAQDEQSRRWRALMTASRFWLLQVCNIRVKKGGELVLRRMYSKRLSLSGRPVRSLASAKQR